MQRVMLKSKIHRAHLTGLHLHYEGSITIDDNLLQQADLLPGERVDVLNLNNGVRFQTYIIRGPAGSGEVSLNGPAARLGMPGDQVVIISYSWMDEDQARQHVPRVILVDEDNRPLA